MNMHWLKNTVFALAIAMVPALGVAADKVGVRPFTEHGVVDAPPEQDVVVISDSTYHLTDRTTITTLRGQAATTSDLTPGTKVGFNMYGTRAERFISDIWILPKDFNLDVQEDD